MDHIVPGKYICNTLNCEKEALLADKRYHCD